MGKVLFPSRPKPQNPQLKKRQQDKQKIKQKKAFFNTIKDMRQMVQKHYGSYVKDTLGMNKKNTKVPFTHLIGRRNKIAQKYSHQKARSKQQNIQYDSSLQLLNSNIIQQSKRQKDQFQKNKYKFEGLNQGKIGRQRDGMLTLSKKDVMRINGKTFQPRNNHKSHHQKHQNNQGKKTFKHKKVFKSKKGNKNGKK